jgi:excisionase family DNA binding protein
MERHQADTTDETQAPASPWRAALRTQALRNAMRKRAAGVPTYSVPEAAALLSISQEYLYRLIQADGFPAVRIRVAHGHGRYVVPARAVEQLLDGASTAGTCIESADFTANWRAAAASPSARTAEQEGV